MLLAEPEGQPQPVVRVLGELLGHPAPQQGVGVGDVVAGGYVQGHDLERGPWACHSKNGGQVSR